MVVTQWSEGICHYNMWYGGVYDDYILKYLKVSYQVFRESVWFLLKNII